MAELEALVSQAWASLSAGLTALRRLLTVIGAAGLVLVLVSMGLFGVALAQGVHCPDCDFMLERGARLAWWQGYFAIKDRLLLAGACCGLVGLLGADWRKWGALALGLAFVSVLLTPM